MKTLRASFEIGPGQLNWFLGTQQINEALQAKSIEALDMAAAAVLQRLRVSFQAEQGPDGTPWKPSKSGARRKAQGLGQTMFKTGNLFHSIQLFRVGENERAIGTDVEYGRKHQFGKGDMFRPFLGLTDEHRSLVESIFVKKLKTLGAIK